MTFWSGLSGYHEKLAKGDKHITNVMEVLDVTNDQEWSDWDDSDGDKPGINDNKDTESDSSSSDSSDSEDDGEDDSGSKKFIPDFGLDEACRRPWKEESGKHVPSPREEWRGC